MAKPLLFVIGDSISLHYGPYLQKMLAGRYRYARKTGQERAVKARSATVRDPNGGDSSAVLAYIQAMLTDKKWRPDVLLLNCGLHDIKTTPATGDKQVPLATYRDNLRQIVSTLAAAKIRTIWVRTTPVDDKQHNTRSKNFHRFAADLASYNRAADTIMKDAGIVSIDLHSLTLSLGDDLFCDHVHYRDPVRQNQAAFIAGFVLGSCFGVMV